MEKFNPEKIFTSYIKNEEIKAENVEYGKDFIKFKEVATQRVFIIMVREERPGTKIIVTERKKADKKTGPRFSKCYKPI